MMNRKITKSILKQFNIKLEDWEQHNVEWIEITYKNGGYKKPSYLQIWIDETGQITDSMSFRGLQSDIIRDSKTDKDIWNPTNACGLKKDVIYDYMSREAIFART